MPANGERRRRARLVEQTQLVDGEAVGGRLVHHLVRGLAIHVGVHAGRQYLLVSPVPLDGVAFTEVAGAGPEVADEEFCPGGSQFEGALAGPVLLASQPENDSCSEQSGAALGRIDRVEEPDRPFPVRIAQVQRRHGRVQGRVGQRAFDLDCIGRGIGHDGSSRRSAVAHTRGIERNGRRGGARRMVRVASPPIDHRRAKPADTRYAVVRRGRPSLVRRAPAVGSQHGAEVLA